MESKVWIVLKERHTEQEQWTIICGVYDNEADAIQRVNEIFDEAEDGYIENYGGIEDFVADNHHNGYAELHLDCGWDETIIKATEYEINKPIYDLI